MDSSQRAQLFFLAILVAVVLQFVLSLRRKKYTLLQWFLWGICLFFCRVLWCVRIPRLDIPSNGRGVMFVANHRSSVDPFYFQSRMDGPMHWMVAREYCEFWAFRWFFKQCEAIPVNRGGVDTRSTKAAIQLAKEGRWVGILPEGRINLTNELLLPVRPGVVFTALRANAIIVPCYIEGSPFNKTSWSPFFMPSRVRVSVGTPIDLNHGDPDAAKEIGQKEAGAYMREIMGQVALLAGQPDYEVQLAGRRWKKG
jgi:1-acyl-sn-glycerol-3-phosphate acyltransferase